MAIQSQRDKVSALHALLRRGIFVTPIAWDESSAAVLALAGASALSTTSLEDILCANVSDSRTALRRRLTVEAVARISGAVELPVTAAVAIGRDDSPRTVASAVAELIDAGAAGLDLVVCSSEDGELDDIDRQVERIRAARCAAIDADLPDLVITAQADVYRRGIGEPERRLADVIAQALVYAHAGADCLSVPGLLDLSIVTTLTGAIDLPVHVVTTAPEAPDLVALRAAGVRRVSLGQAGSEVAYSVAERGAIAALTCYM